MDAPKNNNPSRLVVLLSGLVVVLAGLFLIYFLIQTRAQIEKISPNIVQDTSKITDKYYFEDDDEETHYDYIWENQYSYPELFSHFYLRGDQLENELATQLNVSEESLRDTYNGSYRCLPSPMRGDEELKYGTSEDKQRYLQLKQSLLNSFKINDNPEKVKFFIKSVCKDNSAYYFAFSVSAYMRNKDQGTSIIKQAHAGGIDINPDTYLGIIYDDPQKAPYLMSITPYYPYTEAESESTSENYLINQPKIEVITFNEDETYMPKGETGGGIRSTQGAAYFSYSDLSIYPAGSDYIYMRGRAGDGCCGIDTVLAINLQSQEAKEIFTCINGFGSTLCKNHKGKLYYENIKP